MSLNNFAVVYNNNISHSVEVKDAVISVLVKNNVKAEALDVDNLKNGFDFVIVVGGDGTILKTSRFYAKYKTPIFGINLGRLGFLSQCSAENITQAIEKILSGNYKLEDRIMLEFGNYTALNDFVIKSSLSGRTSRFSLKINGSLI